jgi:ribonuclease J
LSFLKKNIEKVKGIFLTHGHEDHIGALPYVLKEIPTVIYGTRLTLALVENKLKEHKLNETVKKNILSAGSIIRLGNFEVEYVRVSHSIPDSCAIYIKTPAGSMFHTGDFKIDYTPIDGQVIDLRRISEIGQEGVSVLMAESTNVERPGYTMSESIVGKTFEDIFRNAEGRIIVASFASNVHRVQQVIDAAIVNNRKIAVSGRSMVNVTNVARENGYLHVDEEVLIDVRDLDRYPDNEIVLLTTGSQGEPMSALARMASMEHRNVEITPGDLVIFSSSPIPGNEKSVKKIINLLYERGAEVVYEALENVHVSGHACREELKLIHTLINPDYFMPVHGEYSMLKHHASLAEEIGMSKDSIFVMSNGNVLEFDESGAKMAKNVPSGRTLIDGLGIGDVGNIVLRDRKILAEDGIMIVVMSISKETGMVLSGPDIVTRGFVYVRESESLITNAKVAISKSLEKYKSKNVKEWSVLKNDIRDTLKNYLYQHTMRTPMILPIIMEV